MYNTNIYNFITRNLGKEPTCQQVAQ